MQAAGWQPPSGGCYDAAPLRTAAVVLARSRRGVPPAAPRNAVLLTVSGALAAMTAMRIEPLGWVAAVGVVIWLAGFGIEVTADRQKARFRRDAANDGQFITTGLWAWSRHPSYFGEILLWVGVAVVALPALRGWQHVTLISPVFVYLLLTRISGVPLLEARAEARWGELPKYQAYRNATPSLVPRPPRN